MLLFAKTLQFWGFRVEEDRLSSKMFHKITKVVNPFMLVRMTLYFRIKKEYKILNSFFCRF